jgi:hypothetical protein
MTKLLAAIALTIFASVTTVAPNLNLPTEKIQQADVIPISPAANTATT